MRRFDIPHVEMHIHHNCNMKCRYCAHYCDYGYGGPVPFETGSVWMRSWAERIHPKAFHILGGEPLLSADAERYIRLAQQLFPNARRWFVSNGILLCKREELLPVLIETGTGLLISLHADYAPGQPAMVNAGLKLARSYEAQGLRLNVLDTTRTWAKMYDGEGLSIRPYGDEKTSFQNCFVQPSAIIQDGKLWKCPLLAFLPLIADRLETKELWEPYLTYKPLEPGDSDERFEAFLKGEDSCCSMCPSNRVVFDPGPLDPQLLDGIEPPIVFGYEIGK